MSFFLRELAQINRKHWQQSLQYVVNLATDPDTWFKLLPLAPSQSPDQWFLMYMTHLQTEITDQSPGMAAFVKLVEQVFEIYQQQQQQLGADHNISRFVPQSLHDLRVIVSSTLNNINKPNSMIISNNNGNNNNNKNTNDNCNESVTLIESVTQIEEPLSTPSSAASSSYSKSLNAKSKRKMYRRHPFAPQSYQRSRSSARKRVDL
jgi:hypothetical protein